MALVSKNPITSIFSVKNLLFSITVVFMAMILKLYLPIVFESVVSVVPMLWTTLGFWFTPPYLYVVVNVIIIAIAASSRFQQKMDQGAPMKIQTNLQKVSSVEYKTEFEPQLYRHVEVEKEMTTTKKQNKLEVKTRKKPVEAKPEFQAMESSKIYEHMEAKPVEVKTQKKTKESELKFKAMEKTKKKLVEFKLEFERMKPEKYGRIDAKNTEVKNKMETSAKEVEDKHARSKSMATLDPVNLIQIPLGYSLSEEKGLASHRLGHEELDEESAQAGKEVRATEAEDNDTLDGTWKMIMENSRIHNAALQEVSLKPKKFKQSNNLRSPSQSRRKQDTFNY